MERDIRTRARRGGEGPLELAGRTVVLTGATAGIGRAAALALARRGARLVLVCRSVERGRAVLEEVRTAARGGASELLGMDLAALGSVRIGAAELLRRHDRLDVLINNAGLWPPRRELSADGFELTFAVNHLAPFLLTRLLLPALRAAPAARIVNVASEAHRGGRMHWDDLQLERRFSSAAAYSQSKLANVLFTRELARLLAGSGVTANSLHPGFIATELGRNLSAPARLAFRLFGGRPEDGAQGLVHLAAAPDLAGVTGRYYDRTRESTPSRAAQDDEAAARLWEISERMTP